MTPLSSFRVGELRQLRDSPLDVLVIGGGIVGAGVARDAALRGLRVGLIDGADFAGGTSSRSSRLLHGGIRYLAQGRIGLVREASVEKTILHRIAPHLSEPLPFIFPSYRGQGWPLWQLRIGVHAYDLLCGGRNLGRSEGMDRTQTLRRVPGLAPDDLNGAVRYFDGLTNDARLVIDTLRSASNAGATCVNHVRFRDARRHGDTWQCEVEDRLRGEVFSISARAVVNATGPWAGKIPHSQVNLRLTKGIHLVLDRARFPYADAVVITEASRILFVIPWGERVIVGTTDTDYFGDPAEVRSDGEDVAYLLHILRRFFPGSGVGEDDIVQSWAGLRPLIADPSGKPSDISRTHQIRSPEAGWWDVAGGKLTTYRLMAEQTVDRILRSRRERRPSVTAREPLLPQTETVGVSGIVPPAFTRAAVRHYCEREWSHHLDDVMIRRAGWHYYQRDAFSLAEEAAAWMAEDLGWSAERQADEFNRYCRLSDHPVPCPI